MMTHPDAPCFGSEFSSGMKLREYIATQAMAAILANPKVKQLEGILEKDLEHIVSWLAVRHADALIAELSKPKEVPHD